MTQYTTHSGSEVYHKVYATSGGLIGYFDTATFCGRNYRFMKITKTRPKGKRLCAGCSKSNWSK